MVNLIIIKNLQDEIEILCTHDRVRMINLLETTDDGDFMAFNERYYIQDHIGPEDITVNEQNSSLMMAAARKALKAQHMANLQGEYEELSMKLSILEEQLSENLEKQTKIDKGEE